LRNSEDSIICLCETWLDSNFPHSLLNVEKKHTVYRLDRKGKGGGLAIIVPVHIHSTRCNELSYMNSVFEALVIKLRINKIVYSLGLFYRIPKDQAVTGHSTTETPAQKEESIASLVECIKDVSESAGTSFIVGDFNFPKIDWSNLGAKIPERSREFVDIMADCGYQQFVDGPTRIANCLDLFFCNLDGIVSNCVISEPFGVGTEFVSDHKSLRIGTIIGLTKKTAVITKIPNFRKVDWEALELFLLGVSWDELFANCLTLGEMVNDFTDFMNYLIKVYVPLSRFSSQSGFLPVWSEAIEYLKETEMELRRRNKLLFDRNELGINEQYERIDVTKEIRRLKAAQLAKHEDDSLPLHNIRKFWNTVNGKLKPFAGLPTLVTSDGTVLETDEAKALEFNQYFASNYTKPDGKPVPLSINHLQVTSHNINFEPFVIQKVLKQLSSSVSRGPDGVPSLWLKKLAIPLAEPLSRIFNLSFQTSRVPDSWKIAHVVPIPKVINSSSITDYRPISLTSNICKTMEKMISTELINHCQKLGIFKKFQYGFLPGKSCELLLLNCVHKWINNTEKKIPTDLISIDFAKAFEKMSHPMLLQKLTALGVHPKIIAWIDSYLQIRLQMVKIGQATTVLLEATSGAAQGSRLAPILFIISLFDLPSLLHFVCIVFYADDAYISAGVRNIAESALFQADLNIIGKWSVDNKLPINAKKTKAMQLGGKLNLGFRYTIHNEPIEVVENQLALGVWLDSNLNFGKQTIELVNKCNRTVGGIKHSFRNRNIDKLSIMFKSLVRSKLEYCSAVWNPSSVENVNRIEKVQRKFSKWFATTRDLSYLDRLIELSLETLEFRRLVHDLVLVYKLVQDTDRTEFDEFFVLESVDCKTRGHSLKIKKIRAGSKQQSDFWSFRVVNLWNKLLNTTVRAQSANAFRKALVTVEKLRLTTDFEAYSDKIR
jgi:hypothetical protein